MDPKNPSNKPSGQGSGSDTVSAAKVSGASTGNAGQPGKPGQSATLASHTSKPMGGSQTGSGASSQARSPGPEHTRHQDKDAGQGSQGGSGGGGSSGGGQGGLADQARGAADTVKQTAQSAAETARQAASQVQERAGDLYEQASDQAGQAYEQATEYARSAYDQASNWASGAYEQGSRYAESARRAIPDVRQARGSIERFVGENPILVGVVGLAAGLLIGALLPRTRREDQTFGRWADEVRDQGMRYARDMAHRGREFVEDTIGGDDDQFGSPNTDWRSGDQRRQRSGPSGRFQNH
jgi:ElaB/YqjD/DUF883 family membrane-anchored ribosome-binding protein